MPLKPRGDRIIATANLRRQERSMHAAATSALEQYRRLLLRAISHTAIVADASPDEPLGPDVDLSQLDQSAAWLPILEETILPEIVTVIGALGPPDAYLTPSVLSSINAWRAQWLSDRTQVLVGIPNEITAEIRAAIQADTEEFGPNPYRTAETVKERLGPDAPTWKSRADTIARTEVISANNQGSYHSYRAVHNSIAHLGGQVLQTWLATSDGRTRPDHAAVDGTEIPIGQSFTVGGWTMNGPGDPAAPADEVVNCRCTSTYRIDDGASGIQVAGVTITASGTDARSDDSTVLTAAVEVNGDVPKGVAVMALLAPADAGRCAIAGGEAPENLHVTLGYLAQDADQYDDAQKASIVTGLTRSAAKMPITADAFATAQFNPDSDERDPCAVLLVQSDELAALHSDVADELAVAMVDQATTFPIWIPHVAIAYNADTTVIPTAALGELTFDRLVLGWGGEQINLSDANQVDPTSPITAAAPEAPVTAPADTTDQAPDQPADTTETSTPASTPGAVQWEGCLAVLDEPSSDNRMIAGAGFTMRQMPLPLSYQLEGSHGGEEAGRTVIVGRIMTCEVRGNQVWGTGDFLDPLNSMSPLAAIEQVAAGIGFISLDLPVQVVTYMAPGPNGSLIPVDPMQFVGDPFTIVEVAEQSEIAGATIISISAFRDARINLAEQQDQSMVQPVVADGATPSGPILTSADVTFPDGTVVKVGEQVTVVDGTPSGDPAQGSIDAIDPSANTVTVTIDTPEEDGGPQQITVDAASIDIVPAEPSDEPGDAVTAAAMMQFKGLSEEHVYPAAWFEPLALEAPTRLTITADGRVYGHVAEKGTCHIGFANCVTPPSSPSGYGYFHVGDVKTDQGMLPVGKLTVGGGHADINAGWRAAIEHYDNAGAAVAIVRAHEDEHGIQVTGALLANASGEQIAALRRNHLSGDWRVIGGHREMVAAHSINTGGFPLTPRAALAADGRPMALVAAGIVYGDESSQSPEQAGLTLPSGAKITAKDVALLASVFGDVLDRRTEAASAAEQRASEMSALRTRLMNERRAALKASLRIA